MISGFFVFLPFFKTEDKLSHLNYLNTKSANERKTDNYLMRNSINHKHKWSIKYYYYYYYTHKMGQSSFSKSFFYHSTVFVQDFFLHVAGTPESQRQDRKWEEQQRSPEESHQTDAGRSGHTHNFLGIVKPKFYFLFFCVVADYYFFRRPGKRQREKYIYSAINVFFFARAKIKRFET